MRARAAAISRIGLVALAVAWTGCAPGRVSLPGAIAPAARDDARVVRVRVSGRVQRIPIDDYVTVAALSEVTPTGVSGDVVARVYEVQAVIARTYALSHLGRHGADGFDLCDDTHCQLYQPARLRTSRFAADAAAAARRTRGITVRRNGVPIEAVFHANCGGHTTTPSAAWGGTDHPHLPARPDDVPGHLPGDWVFEASLVEWRTLLNSDPRTRVGDVLTGLRVARTGAGDRAMAIAIDGTRSPQVSGEVFRAVVSAARGPRALRSTAFRIERTSAGFRLAGSGFGHGVGLCQAGALARARRGDSLRSILEHYFPGTALE